MPAYDDWWQVDVVQGVFQFNRYRNRGYHTPPLDVGPQSCYLYGMSETFPRGTTTRNSNTPETYDIDERVDIYFSADVETDGPIPGPFSLLSFAMVYAGRFAGGDFERPTRFDRCFYRELKPISTSFEPEALRVNQLDRDRLCLEGEDPQQAMSAASRWVREIAGTGRPVLVAYPLSFDWTWLYWYFVRYSEDGSPFNHSGCFDIKTAYSVKARIPVAAAGRSNLEGTLLPNRRHTHHALDDALEQAEIFANLFEWNANDERRTFGTSSNR